MSTTSTSTTSTDRPSARIPIGITAVVLALALVAGACGDDGEGDGLASETSAATADGSTSTTTGDTTSTTAVATTAGSDSVSTTSTTASTTSTTGLAGQPWEGFAQNGDVLAVLGVANDDVLNVRAGPGTDTEIVATADPTADDLVATGRARELPRSFWYEVTVDGVTGWVSISFVAYQGGTDDATAEFLDGGPRPEVETMEEMGELVAEFFASDEPPSDIVQSVAPTVGDLGEVTYDVVGIGDDAGAGYRLHVFANPSESGEGFVLASIERTWYCTRGLSGELCV